MTENPVAQAAKMICKSMDALTREVYMLRRDLNDKDKLKEMLEELDKGSGQIPLPTIGRNRPALLAEGKHFQL